LNLRIRADIKLMQRSLAFFGLAGKSHSVDAAIAIIGNDELRVRLPKIGLQYSDAVPLGGNGIHHFPPEEVVEGRVPGRYKQFMHCLEIGFCRASDPHYSSIPSLALTSSLTDCGLALPPVAFMT